MTSVLVDKSAYEQRRHSAEARAVLDGLATKNRLAISDVVALEILYSTRGIKDYEARWLGMQALVWLPMNAEVGQAALDIQRKLAKSGEHRRPIQDLLIAATALVHGATVLHYDKDFDLIAEVTGQRAVWIIPRGSGH